MKRNGKFSKILVALLSAMMIFAATGVSAFAGVTDMDPGTTVTYKAITSITVNGYKDPVIGEKADTSDITITVEPADSATILEAKWWNPSTSEWLSSDDEFVEYETYNLHVTVVPNEGYLLTPSMDEDYTGKAEITGAGVNVKNINVDGTVGVDIFSTLEVAKSPAESEDPADTEDPSDTEDPAEPEEPSKPEDPAEPEEPSESEDPAVTETTMVPIYRLYLPSTGEHLYTSDKNEYDTLYNKYHWGQEGIAWYAPEDGEAVYRLYQPDLKNHLYTTDLNEVKVLTTTAGWKLDNNGEPLYYSGGDVSIYRVYNKGLSGMHHLTTDQNEYNVLTNGKYGWTKEGQKLLAVKVGEPFETTKFK